MAKEPIVLSNEIAPTPTLVRARHGNTLPVAILPHGESTVSASSTIYTTIRNFNTPDGA
jgi:hypothetical protein